MVIPALFSILDSQENIAEEGTKRYLRFLQKRGIKEFYINGSTAEAFILSVEQRKRNLEIIRNELGSDCLLIVQIGGISTKESISLAKHAQDVGVDVISAVMPFYYKFSWEEILQHYQSILASTNLPFCPYYIPKLSGVDANLAQLSAILQNDKVQYLKYTSNDFYMLERLRKKFPNLIILNGYDEMLLAGVSVGANGGIGSTYNFTSEQAKKLLAAVHTGKITEARIMQQEINDFIDLLIEVGLFQGMKYLLSKFGINSERTCRPLLPLSTSGRNRIEEYLLGEQTIV